MEGAEWIQMLTSLAGMITAWLSLRDQLKSKDSPTTKQRDEVSSSGKAAVNAVTIPHLVVSQDILRAVIEDVKAVEARFAAAIKDPTRTTEQIDQEQARARQVICIHLKRLQDLNAGKLPTEDLKRMWLSFGCGPSTDKTA